jgi:hypothetical protein
MTPHHSDPATLARSNTDRDRTTGELRRLEAAALTAAGRGWHVFPLVPNAKRPAVKDWERRATTDPARIRAAWSASAYGIGVACGPSRLCVVDLDRPKPGEEPPGEWRIDGVHDGSDVLAVLAERAGQPYPGDTYAVRTASGGLHLYFTRPAGTELRNTAGALGWLVDTRAAGGYVVATGSTVDGHPYEVVADRPPAPLPDWISAALTRPAPVNPAAGPAASDRLPAYLRAAVAGELARVAAATRGSRNHTLYIAAIALGQLAAGGALNAKYVTAELEHAAAGVGLGQAEAVATIRSGLRAGARRPRTLGSPVGGAAA